MNEEKAREILGDIIKEDNSLFCLGQYIAWPIGVSTRKICLDAYFKIEELEAIVWWVNNKIIDHEKVKTRTNNKNRLG